MSMQIEEQTPERQALLGRAAWLGQGDGPEQVVSFHSLFLAFFSGSDALALTELCRALLNLNEFLYVD